MRNKTITGNILQHVSDRLNPSKNLLQYSTTSCKTCVVKEPQSHNSTHKKISNKKPNAQPSLAQQPSTFQKQTNIIALKNQTNVNKQFIIDSNLYSLCFKKSQYVDKISSTFKQGQKLQKIEYLHSGYYQRQPSSDPNLIDLQKCIQYIGQWVEHMIHYMKICKQSEYENMKLQNIQTQFKDYHKFLPLQEIEIVYRMKLRSYEKIDELFKDQKLPKDKSLALKKKDGSIKMIQSLTTFSSGCQVDVPNPMQNSVTTPYIPNQNNDQDLTRMLYLQASSIQTFLKNYNDSQ